MPWKETNPGLWQRPIGENEKFIKFIGDRAHTAGREHWAVTAGATFTSNIIIPPSELAGRCREAWCALRFDHPSIACTADGDKLSYMVGSAESVASWATETLVVHQQGVHVNDVVSTLKPSQYTAAHIIPGEEAQVAVLLHFAHWRTDGYGALQLAQAFLGNLCRIISGDARDLPWGEEVTRLTPSIEEVLDLPLLPTPEILEATRQCMETLTYTRDAAGVAVTVGGNTAPAGTRSARLRLGESDTEAVLRACEARNISLVSAVHASCAALTHREAHPGRRDKPYTSTMRFSLRPHLPQPYNTADYAAALYTGGYMIRTEAAQPWLRTARQYEEQYARGVTTDMLRCRREYAVQVLGVLQRGSPPPDPPPSEVDISSVGEAERLVSRRVEWGDAIFEVQDVSIGVETLTRQTYCFLWTFRGRLELNLVYNEAFYAPKRAEQMVHKLGGILLAELGKEVAIMDDETVPLLPPRSLVVDLSSPTNPLNPVNLPPWRKWAGASALGSMTFVVAFASAVFNAAIPATAEEFGVSPEAMAWGTSLFVFGFATGPILMGPASELYGRKLPFFLGYLLFVLAQIPVGLGHDAATVLVFRFLGGVTSSVCPAITGGWLADFLLPVERGVAVAIFAATTLVGPGIGAIASQMLVQSALGWRWIAWVTMALGVVFGVAGYIILPETYLPVLETRRARQLRLETGNWALHSKQEEHPVGFGDFVTKYLTRPMAMLVMEPIIFSMTAYISFTFGLIYLLFVAYPISFVQERGFSAVGGTLPLLAICLGIILGGFYASWFTLTAFKKKVAGGKNFVPEDRLPPMIVGAVSLTIGLFWFAWTSSPAICPWYQIVAGVPVGVGIQVILLQALAYLIDMYTTRSASAISGTMIVRSLIGGTFPLFAGRVYHRLGVFWATNLLGVCALALTPIPVVFLYYGGKIRSLGRYGMQ
ncbi:hypothetical protein OQA88_4339 [Cercophora sp. LCS_1]